MTDILKAVRLYFDVARKTRHGKLPEGDLFLMWLRAAGYEIRKIK